MDFFKSLLPDFGPAGFYDGFLRFLEVTVLTFILGGLQADLPLVKILEAHLTPTEATLVDGVVLGGALWAITWLKNKTQSLTPFVEAAPADTTPVMDAAPETGVA